MYLVITFLEQMEGTERAIRRLREFGIPEPLVVRARSAAAALSAEVPVFAGLRSLALGADEDRVLLVSMLPAVSAEEMERMIQRVQLEMDADDPPMGRLVALPVIAAPTHRRS
ncbi:hypothetical protein HUA74_36940 [Myxococcus sp. CA051A]|uniref:Uncharacterized protein n=1 Tax=Myxococcus llanfairpwllgwyngyllgogerychwyrndrobwllllantysiliogogogochensis TaxID=2590453 RepID=A0A540WKL4_9BACT|nr:MULTISPECIES: hypothetical protein [Myxococcus]NTX02520.1 hypothetical protein [Myxococcus sp. CA040A]NTX16984.1 hypothetical protein [Myxococcus sp. CA056]NTX36626.1 hypothetical protein [Myxococcus sp. CA033]NTX57391.1 hypothetical protein [Myxococcus sp. CA039A]NTX66258.1 hypothetical protein [Myxococcus sp. CA051A]NVJ24910.1 hypothetical protein [Myxococcus sp. AM011]